MRVLVTGHRGYIGTVMVPMLMQAGHTVFGLDSDLFEQCTFQPGIFDVPQRRLDLRDVQAKDLEGFDAILHLAAIAGRAGIKIDLRHLNELSDTTPVLVDLKPTGAHYMEDLFAAGGIGAVRNGSL